MSTQEVENNYVAVEGSVSSNKEMIEEFTKSLPSQRSINDLITVHRSIDFMSEMSQFGDLKFDIPDDIDECSFLSPIGYSGEQLLNALVDSDTVKVIDNAVLTINSRGSVDIDDSINHDDDLLESQSEHISNFLMDEESILGMEHEFLDNQVNREMIHTRVRIINSLNDSSKQDLDNRGKSFDLIVNPQTDVSKFAPSKEYLSKMSEIIPSESDLLEIEESDDDSQGLEELSGKVIELIDEYKEDSFIDAQLENTFYERFYYNSKHSTQLMNHFNVMRSGLYNLLYTEKGEHQNIMAFPGVTDASPNASNVVVELAENVPLESAMRKTAMTTMLVVADQTVGGEDAGVELRFSNSRPVGIIVAFRFNMDSDGDIEANKNGDYIMFFDKNLYSYVAKGGACVILSAGSISREEKENGFGYTINHVSVVKNSFDSPQGYSKKETKNIAKNIVSMFEEENHFGSDEQDVSVTLDSDTIYSARFNDYSFVVDSVVSKEFIDLKLNDISSKCAMQAHKDAGNIDGDDGEGMDPA